VGSAVTAAGEASNGQGSRALSADVAREAGVSRATVSYVLNNRTDRSISDATRARVLATARRLGHVPHAPARSLRLGRSNVVLALVSDFAFGYLRDRLLSTLDAAMTRRGYVLLVHRYSEELRPLPELWRLVAPDVVVSMGGLSVSEADSLRGARAQLISVQSLFDHTRAGEMQAEYLVGKGHRRLGYAYPSEGNVRSIAEERLAGTRLACRRLGVPPPAVMRVDRRHPTTLSRALERWNSLADPPTAICAHNDEIAVMLSLADSSRGFALGDRLAVIGMDDIPISRLGISTIALDVDLVTERIVEQVVATLEGRVPQLSAQPVLRVISRASA
jgi:DNA-binding LacI/PurR family transcriptional regulator